MAVLGSGRRWDWGAAVHLRVASVGAHDRLGVVGWASAEGDLDLSGLFLFGFGDSDLEYAAVEVSLHGFGVDAVREREGAGEVAERALDSVVSLCVLFV